MWNFVVCASNVHSNHVFIDTIAMITMVMIIMILQILLTGLVSLFLQNRHNSTSIKNNRDQVISQYSILSIILLLLFATSLIKKTSKNSGSRSILHYILYEKIADPMLKKYNSSPHSISIINIMELVTIGILMAMLLALSIYLQVKNKGQYNMLLVCLWIITTIIILTFILFLVKCIKSKPIHTNDTNNEIGKPGDKNKNSDTNHL